MGEHFPPNPLVGLAVRRGIGVPELWIATEGAGVLIYDGQQMKQLLPSTKALRKVSALLPLRNGQVILGTPNTGVYITDGKRLDARARHQAARRLPHLEKCEIFQPGAI